ncbi:MAG: hypothetical protein JWO62_347 [Acidimicrobiaceae bacterium]|nr:hypothetical protein [Acidimicrobiaceae bacterium]
MLGEDGTLTPIGSTLAELLQLDLPSMRERCERAAGERLELSAVSLHPPVEARMEVWAAGVTYERSRDERMKESTAAASVYDDVYDAPRPELFFKSVPWRVAADGDPIGIREDSAIDVPEAELALVVNALGAIAGYTICNDVSSRSIEGENPLYLPQAKIYSGSCSLASRVRPSWEVPDPYALQISVAIERSGSAVYEASASTARLHRRLDDLVSWLGREMDFPDGAILSTGTALVPDLPFTLEVGDVVRVAIPGIGGLVNPVAAATTILHAK